MNFGRAPFEVNSCELLQLRPEGFQRSFEVRRAAKFSTWLIQITINEARMKFRKDRRHLYESIDDQRPDEDGDYLPSRRLVR